MKRAIIDGDKITYVDLTPAEEAEHKKGIPAPPSDARDLHIADLEARMASLEKKAKP